MMNEYLNHNNYEDDYYYVGFPMDVEEIDGGYKVICDIPGVAKENIHISFEDGLLTIRVKKTKDKNHNKYLIHERSFMDMKRTVNFEEIDEESIAAKYKDGILEITLNTLAEKPKKVIEIA